MINQPFFGAILSDDRTRLAEFSRGEKLIIVGNKLP